MTTTRRLSRTRQVLLGALLGSLVSAGLPQPASAQFGGIVYDPQNHATAIQHRIEDWLHWVQELNDNIQQIELLIKQWTTLKDVLRNAEKLVAHNLAWATTMASIGASIRGIYRLKDSLLNLVRYRVRALISIRNRLKNGIFSPSADLADLEEYLRDGLGRASAARLATLERLASFDVTLQTLYERWSEACARRAGLEKELKELKARHDEAVARGDAPDAIASLEIQIQQVEQKIIDVNKMIDDLWTQMVERAKKYHITLIDREVAARKVAEMYVAWDTFLPLKEELIEELERYNRDSQATRPRWVDPPNGGVAVPLDGGDAGGGGGGGGGGGN